MVVKKTKKDKEEVCEIFEVSKGKKQQEKIACGDLDNKHASKKQMIQFNKTLGIVLVVLLLMTAVFLSIFFFKNYTPKIDYKGTEFVKEKSGEITFYHTSFPSTYNGKNVTYNLWIRNNPLDLVKKINVNESFNWKKLIVTNFSGEYLHCNGDDVIAKFNFNKILNDGMKLTAGPSETFSCDSQGRYMYLELVEGNKTQIEKTGPSCYKLEFANCEVLPVTERFLIEIIAEYNQEYNSNSK